LGDMLFRPSLLLTMHAQKPLFALLIPALAAVLHTTTQVYASPATTSDALVQRQPAAYASISLRQFDPVSRDGHSHHNSHAVPNVQLNETEVLMYHAPTPDSYWTIDIDGDDPDVSRHPGLMILHGLLMSLAFFVALPMGKFMAPSWINLVSIDITRAGIAMRSVKHAWHGFVVTVFYGLCVLGCAASALYTKLTPNM
jgi:hypothetical protein